MIFPLLQVCIQENIEDSNIKHAQRNCKPKTKFAMLGVHHMTFSTKIRLSHCLCRRCLHRPRFHFPGKSIAFLGTSSILKPLPSIVDSYCTSTCGAWLDDQCFCLYFVFATFLSEKVSASMHAQY